MPDSVASSSFSGPTAWNLLGEFASIGQRNNATIATGSTSTEHHVEVSFELVDPPGESRWFVHCPSLEKRSSFGPPHILPDLLETRSGFNGPPQILNTADALLIIRMEFFTDKGLVTDYFVYRAGPGKPSLDLIPGPCPKVLFPKQIGIIPGGRGSNEHYFVVFPVPRFRPRPVNYEIQVFSSESKAWSNKVARISRDPETDYHGLVMHAASKAVAAGKGELAWIDLWRGVLLCNVLDEDPVLRLLQWPVLPPRYVCIDLYSASSIRDATVSNGIIKFVESKFNNDSGDANDAKGAGWNWRATLWNRDTAAEKWSKCFEADVAKIVSTGNQTSLSLLHNVLADGTKELDLDNVFAAPPILSLQHDDHVYFVAKLKTGNPRALLLAVNGRKERLEAARPISLELTCCPCTIASFLGTNRGADSARQPRKDIRREKENLEPSICAMSVAREQLTQIEKCFAYDQPNYHLCRSLLNTGPLSCLHVNLQAMKVDANGNSRQQSSLNAMTLYQRAMRDIDKLAAQGDLSAHLKGKISIARDALDKLMQTVPGNLMEDGRAQRPRHASGTAKALVSRS